MATEPTKRPIDSRRSVVLSRKAVRRLIWTRALLAIVAIGICAMLARLAVRYANEARLQRAIDHAAEDGGTEAIDEALQRVDAAVGVVDRDAIRARLLATRAWSAGLADTKRAQDALEKLSEADNEAVDALVAHAYVAMQSGDAQAALNRLDTLREFDTLRAELYYARALALYSRGQLNASLNRLDESRLLAPDAPRYRALAVLTARVVTRRGQLTPELGTEDLNVTSAILRIAYAQRAFVLDPTVAYEWVEPLRKHVNPADVRSAVWAQALFAWSEFVNGRPASASTAMRTVDPTPIAWDEALIIRVAQFYIATGDSNRARVLLDQIGTGPSYDMRQRAFTRAWQLAESVSSHSEIAARAALEAANIDPTSTPTSAFESVVLGAISSRHSLEQAQSQYALALQSRVWAPVAAVALALAAQNNKQPDVAQRAIDAGLRTSPGHPWLVWRGVKVALARGDVRAAEATAAQGASDEPWALAARGAALIASNRAQEAIAVLQQAAQRVGDDAVVEMMLATALSATGNFHDAKAHFVRALSVNPNERDARLGLLHAATQTRDFVAARAAIQELDAAPDQSPRADALRARFDALSAQLPHREAARAFDHAVRAVDDNEVVASESDAQAWRWLRVIHFAAAHLRAPTERSLSEANAHSNDADPDEVMRLVALGRVALLDNELTNAVVYANRALRANPTHPHALWLAIDSSTNTSRNAEQHLQTLLSLDPTSPLALSTLAARVARASRHSR